MLRIVGLILIAMPLTLATVSRAQVGEQAASSALTDMDAHLRAAVTMTASLTQTDPQGNTRRGQLSLKRPDKIRLAFDNGSGLVVGNGSRLTFTVGNGYQLSAPLADSPLSGLLGGRELRRVARVVRNDSNTLIIELRNPDRPGFGRITIAFARVQSAPAGLTLVGWNAIDAQRRSTQVRLTNQRYNVEVPETAFRL